MKKKTRCPIPMKNKVKTNYEKYISIAKIRALFYIYLHKLNQQDSQISNLHCIHISAR